MDSENLSPNMQRQFALQREHKKRLERLRKANAKRKRDDVNDDEADNAP